MLTNKLILKDILKIEKKLDEKKFIVNGLNYWPAIRIRIAFYLIQKRYEHLKKKKFLFQLKIFLFILFNIWSKKKKSHVMFVSHKNYLVKVNKSFYDRVLSGHIKKFSNKNISYCYLDLSENKLNHYFSKSICKTEYINIFLIKFVAYVSSFFFKSFQSIATYFEDLSISVDIKNSKDISLYKKKDLIIYLSYIRILKFYFKIFLKKRGIKEVYQSMYYDPIGLAINSAANEIGIKTYCVQHGGQSRNNPAFGKWSIIPKKGYLMLPKKFLCWDSYSKKNLDRWAKFTTFHSTEISGYSWIKMWREGDINFPKIKKISNRNYNIIFTMQPSFNEFPKLVLNLISKFDKNVIFWIRFHPRHHNTKFYLETKKILKKYSNVNLHEATNYPLPALMSKMDLHLTGFSSCIYEASYFKVKTILFDKQGKDYFQEFIENKKAIYLSNVNEIIKFLTKKIKHQ